MDIDLEQRFLVNLGILVKHHVEDAELSFEDVKPIGNLIHFQEICKCWQASEVLCQSPIERLLLSEFLFGGCERGDHFFRIRWSKHPYVTRWNGNFSKFQGVFFDMQEPVGDFRADFLFTCIVKGNARRIAVECDGHDFHERTKEQAARDRRRDRAFQHMGIPILRFTGSELYRDVTACSIEVESFLAQIMADLGSTNETGVIGGKLVGVDQ